MRTDLIRSGWGREIVVGPIELGRLPPRILEKLFVFGDLADSIFPPRPSNLRFQCQQVLQLGASLAFQFELRDGGGLLFVSPVAGRPGHSESYLPGQIGPSSATRCRLLLGEGI
jgi:hypothetical protein